MESPDKYCELSCATLDNRYVCGSRAFEEAIGEQIYVNSVTIVVRGRWPQPISLETIYVAYYECVA